MSLLPFEDLVENVDSGEYLFFKSAPQEKNPLLSGPVILLATILYISFPISDTFSEENLKKLRNCQKGESVAT